MSQAWSKIVIIVAIIHVIALKVCWVGLAVPAQAAHADFFYSNNVMLADSPAVLLPSQKALSVFIPEHLKADASQWKVLQLPKKEKRDARLGL